MQEGIGDEMLDMRTIVSKVFSNAFMKHEAMSTREKAETMKRMNETGYKSLPRRLRWFHLVMLGLPFIGLLWVPLYAHATPEIFGIPFFYTYQFAWILISASLTGLVYRGVR